MRSKEDELDYKSSSDNQEAGSGEDPDEVPRGHKRRHHRHTQHQIQEMERLFKKCPHPDEKARLELSRELNLDPRQVKFWFQNKRTQMKAQQERHDNSFLRNDNDKLRSENQALREAIRNVVCHKCGGPANYAETNFDEQQLKIENARLREEVSRLSAALAEKNKGLSSFATAPSPTSSTDLALQTPSTTANEITTTAGPSVAEIASRPLGLTDAEKPMVVELAVSAMEELAQVAQAGEPLWVPDPHTGIEIFDVEEYMKQFARVISPIPPRLKVEATRETELVVMNATALVETLMDVDRWADMFASIISKASIVEVLSGGLAGSFDGTMQVMYAELQMATPMVPTRDVYFLRYSKRVDELWVVVDVAVDSLRANPPPSLLRCRKRPSGCVVEETTSGYSKVTWVEHVEVDDKGVHPSFQTLVNSGMAFGAQRWLATLQRQCERIVSSLANIRDPGFPNVEGRRAMLKLAERMSKSFCKGVSASASHTWITLSSSSSSTDEAPSAYASHSSINGRDHDSSSPSPSSTSSSACRVVIRKSVEDAGRPPGIVLCAATSLTLPAVPPSRVFEFLSDESYRTEWDILSNMGVVEEMIHISKGHNPGNVVSLLRVNAVTSSQSNMLILQECSVDKAGWMVVYAPVDVNAMTDVLNGGDPDAVLLLPSGFSVLPHHPPVQRLPAYQHPPRVHHHHHPHPPPPRRAAPHSLTADAANGPPSSSLLTVAFQILVDHLPTAKLSLESIATVNTLISSTVARIRGSLSSCDL